MKNPALFVVLQERAAGNESVGTQWIDVATFKPTSTLAEVWAWAHEHGGMDGRTMIRPDLTIAVVPPSASVRDK